jgi:DEAD/DEAH box helicase domain-containing protein
VSDPRATVVHVPIGSTTGWTKVTQDSRARHVRRSDARAGVTAPWPDWLPSGIVASVVAAGIAEPWAHQVVAAEAAWQGRHVALATGAASGKSLGYLLPVLAATAARADEPEDGNDWRWRRRPCTALYLAPTKALAHDQLRASAELGPRGWPIAALDGDSTPAERDWARDYAAYVLTNPDMLHYSLLPNHQRWAAFLRTLRFVVVDESHRYRGVFGAQVAAVLRRLRRLAAHYGAEPVFVVASATVGDAAQASAALIGVDASAITVIEQDQSARGQVEILLWQPDGHPDDDAAILLAEAVAADQQTIAFVGSRRSAEIVALNAQRELRALGSDRHISAYRAGYLAADRRELERALQTGTLNGVAATNALELGVDIAGLDAVIISGFPGTRAAFRQQAGRAGRKGRDSRVVLVARKHPIDAYLLDHPGALFDQPVEGAVLEPAQAYVLGPQLAAAAQELPLTEADSTYFGEVMRPLLEQLVRNQTMRRRPGGWYWTRPERAVDGIDLRSSGGERIEIIEIGTGRVLGGVDPMSADSALHPGAVYVHRGETYLCEELNGEEHEALVRAARTGYLTQPRIQAGIAISSVRAGRPIGGGRISFGEVAVTSRVTGYLRRDELSGTVWDQTPLDLPERTLRTTATWWSLDLAAIPEEFTLADLAGGAHGVEHAALGLLPIFSRCDRWDVRGHSTSSHPDTGVLTVFVYDLQPGGAGFAERAYELADGWLATTRDRVSSCDCEHGCPACIVSAECGAPGAGLDKGAAVALLSLLAPEQ